MFDDGARLGGLPCFAQARSVVANTPWHVRFAAWVEHLSIPVDEAGRSHRANQFIPDDVGRGHSGVGCRGISASDPSDRASTNPSSGAIDSGDMPGSDEYYQALREDLSPHFELGGIPNGWEIWQRRTK